MSEPTPGGDPKVTPKEEAEVPEEKWGKVEDWLKGLSDADRRKLKTLIDDTDPGKIERQEAFEKERQEKDLYGKTMQTALEDIGFKFEEVSGSLIKMNYEASDGKEYWLALEIEHYQDHFAAHCQFEASTDYGSSMNRFSFSNEEELKQVITAFGEQFKRMADKEDEADKSIEKLNKMAYDSGKRRKE